MLEKIKKYLMEFKSGTKLMFKEFFKKETNKKQRANMWTFSRLISAFLIAICSIFAVISANPILFVAASFLTAFGGMTDYFDGRSARKYGSTSEYGKLLDQASDKVFSGLTSLSLLLVNPYYLLILLGEMLIAEINIGYSKKYKDLKINSTLIGKIKQWPLVISLIIGFLSPINNVLLAISDLTVNVVLVMQILTANSYIKQNKEEIRKNDINKKIALIERIDDEEKEKTKSLELTKDNNVEINNKSSLSRKEQYQALRDLLNEIIKEKTDNNTFSNELKNELKIKK